MDQGPIRCQRTIDAPNAADGYTLVLTGGPPHGVYPFLMKNVLFDTVKDFMIGTSPRCVVVHPSLPVPLAVRSETRLIPEPGFLRLPLGLLLVFHFS